MTVERILDLESGMNLSKMDLNNEPVVRRVHLKADIV